MNKDEFTNEDPLDLDEILRLIEEEPSQEAQPETLTCHRETVSAQPEKKEDVKDARKNTVLYLHDLAYLIAGIVLIFLLLFRIVVVSGDSMYATLRDGDYLILLSNVLYHDPQPGDIIVASKQSYDNGTPIIKRVIATGGQTVDIDFRKGIVYVDGVALDEDYTYTSTTVPEGVEFPLTVDEGCVFVLGDNRERSKDSRNPEIGLIDERQIVGKAIILIFPGAEGMEHTVDFSRIGVIG